MAVEKRPYFVVHKGIQHMVEAVGPAQAVQHVVGVEITELRVARPAEVLAWARANKPIAVAGAKPAPAPLLDDAREGWDASDARAWLIEKCGGLDDSSDALATFDVMREQGEMTAAQFAILNASVPGFGETLCSRGSGTPYSVHELSNMLDGTPMPFDEIVVILGDAKRDELFEDPAAANERAVVEK